MTRVVHVMDHSVPMSDGYSVRPKYLLEAQAASGDDVLVVTSPSQGAGATDLTLAGVRYRRSQYDGWESGLAKRGAKQLVFGSAIRRQLAKTLDENACDILHGHTPFTVARVALAEARRRGVPFVYEKRNLWEESALARGKASGRWPFYQIAKAVDRWVTQRADAVCTITQALKQHTLQLGVAAERIFVVGNGVDVEAFVPREPSPEVRQRCANGADFVIGFVGSFFSFEGLPLLVQAFANICSRYPNTRLVLVGDGEARATLDRLIKELALGDRVLLTGRVPHESVIDYYAAMDLLVYPRYRSALTETISPLKPLEPMAMGKCVLASDVGGLRELVSDDNTGLLFAADSVASLEQRLDHVLGRRIDTVAIGRKARESVVATRQWRHMAARYNEAYTYALAHRLR